MHAHLTWHMALPFGAAIIPILDSFRFLSCQQERSNTEMFYATETKRY